MAKSQRTKGKTTIYKIYIYIYKTKDRVTRTPLKTGGELRCFGGQTVTAPLVTPVVLNDVGQRQTLKCICCVSFCILCCVFCFVCFRSVSCWSQDGSCRNYLIYVCLRIVVSNTHCVVILFCLSSSCVLCTQCRQFLWIIHS